MADESGEINLTDAEKEPEMTEESGEGNLTNEQREALKQAFCDVDIDGSGSLDIKELRAVLQLIGQNPTEAEIQEIMEGCSEEGSMTQEEFCAFVEEKIPLKSEDEVNEELIEAFKKFDTNEDGTIDRDEFLEIMTKKGEEPLTEAEADELMNKLDTGDENNAPDGKLSIAELGKLFMGSA